MIAWGCIRLVYTFSNPMNTLAHRSLLAAIGGLFAVSSFAAPPAQEENSTLAIIGETTWEIRYDSKKEDGVLVRAKGRVISGPVGEGATAFSAGECAIQNDRLTLGQLFVISKGINETASIEPQTRVVLKSNGSIMILGGRAKTRIVQQ
jgi:hypothetical protein